MESSKKQKLIFSLILIPVAIILLIPFVETFMLSVKDFSVKDGIWGSKFIGFEHFKDFFSSNYFDRIITNSLAISSVAVLTGVIYTFFASAAITSIENKALRFLLTFVFCIPGLIPGILIANMLPDSGTSPLFARFMIGVFDGLRLSSFVVFASGFVNGKPWKEGFKFALVFLAIRLIAFFTTDAGMILLSYNDVSYEHLDTLNTYTFRMGIGGGHYSYTSAIDVIRVVLQLVSAVIGCLILIFAFKKKTEPSLKNYQV